MKRKHFYKLTATIMIEYDPKSAQSTRDALDKCASYEMALADLHKDVAFKIEPVGINQ